MFMLWPKKIHARNLITKKSPAARKFPSPPHNFSNGPTLNVNVDFFPRKRMKDMIQEMLP